MAKEKYDTAARKAMAKKGTAMSDGSFPIADKEDLANAIHLAGHASDPTAARRFIRKRAKALGLMSLIPESWESKSTSTALECRVAPLMEYRAAPLEFVLTGANDSDQETHFSGRAAVFGDWAHIGSGVMSFRERIAPGAFTRTLLESDQVMLDSHDSSRIISRRSAGTLELWEDQNGLGVRSRIPNTTCGQDFAENVRNGNIRGMSFGFEVVRDDWAQGGTHEERTIHEVNLREVSGTAFPAYSSTEAAMRDMMAARNASGDVMVVRDAIMNPVAEDSDGTDIVRLDGDGLRRRRHMILTADRGSWL